MNPILKILILLNSLFFISDSTDKTIYDDKFKFIDGKLREKSIG